MEQGWIIKDDSLDNNSTKFNVPKRKLLCKSKKLYGGTVRWDTFSWKGQLEKTRSWKARIKIGKIEV